MLGHPTKGNRVLLILLLIVIVLLLASGGWYGTRGRRL
jgi:hypothetical protein